jgi:hypothetical protein
MLHGFGNLRRWRTTSNKSSNYCSLTAPPGSLEAKWTLPKERVREEISRAIVKQKLDSAPTCVTGGIRADLNQNYFGSAADR